MSHTLTFSSKLSYADTNGRNSPVVGAYVAVADRRRHLAFVLDSGAAISVASGKLLNLIGFEEPEPSKVRAALAEADAAKRNALLEALDCVACETASSNRLVVKRFLVNISILGGPGDILMDLHGTVGVEHFPRNLLGRDFFTKVNRVAFENYEQRIYMGKP